MYKVAVMGEESSVEAFKFLGVDVFPVRNAKEMLEALKENQGRYSIIFVEELFSNEVKDFLNETNGDISVTIIPLSLQGRSSGIAANRIKNLIRKAIGISEL